MSRGRVFYCLYGVGLALACESEQPQALPRAKVHPEFALPASPEMRASVDVPEPGPGQPSSAAPVTWSAGCLSHRGCTRPERPLSPCEPGKVAPAWTDLQRSAEQFLGKQIDVSGTLGLAPQAQTKHALCAKGVCCNTVRLTITLDGAPTALPLQGLACAGDDSLLCCNVPADGQLAIAHGRLARAPAKGAAKFQLEGTSLCLPEVPSPRDH